ncbi:effector-associated constant component EACC1 [Nocardia gipuzkoensis]
MKVSVEINGATASLDSLLGMRRWLEDEPELRGRVDVVPGRPEPGTMTGGAVEQLVMMLGSVGALAVARSIPLWIKQQRSHLEVTITREGGRTVTVRADQVANAEALIREALSEPADDQPPES